MQTPFVRVGFYNKYIPNKLKTAMPNWCKNRVTAYAKNGNEQDIARIVEIFESKDSVFGKIIPSPDWYQIPNEDGELPVLKEHKDADGKVIFATSEFPKSGKSDSRWYDWNIANWDTKWDINKNVEVDQYDSEQVELNFSTAWSPPEAICRKLRDMFPDVGFSWFYDEPGMECAGYL